MALNFVVLSEHNLDLSEFDLSSSDFGLGTSDFECFRGIGQF